MNLFKDVYVPEEHYNITLVNLIFSKSEAFGIINRSTTYTKWLKPNDKHPHSFDELTKEDIDIIKKVKKEGIILFARKFNYFKNNKNILLKLIDN